MKKVFMFVPGFGQIITATTFLTTHALQQAMAQKSIGGSCSTLSFPDIAELRAMAMTIWYDSMPDFDHMLFIDADMGFTPDVVLDMLLFDEPLVGAIYPQRRVPVSWAGSGNGNPQTERRGNFMLVEGVGMGLTLIRRDLVKTMIERMPEIIDTRIDLHPAAAIMRGAGANRIIRAFEKLDIPERGIVSEDLSFCIRWNRLGGKCWAAIGYKISHVGPYDYAACYLEHVQAEADKAVALAQALQPAATLPQATQPATNGHAPSDLPPVIHLPPPKKAKRRRSEEAVAE